MVAVNLINGRVVHRFRKVSETEVNSNTWYRDCSGVGKVRHEIPVCMTTEYLHDLRMALQYTGEFCDNITAAELKRVFGRQNIERRVVHE